MVESIYVQAFKRMMNKGKVKVASPMLKHCALAWKQNDVHLVVKVILELYVAFSLSSFKSSPMLSMLLSVEELESLVVPYCRVFENCIHFLSFFNSVVPQLLLIIIKPWFQSFVISSSPTSIPSLFLPHLPQFFFLIQNRTCTETPIQV
jgi:hypothetical protein